MCVCVYFHASVCVNQQGDLHHCKSYCILHVNHSLKSAAINRTCGCTVVVCQVSMLPERKREPVVKPGPRVSGREESRRERRRIGGSSEAPLQIRGKGGSKWLVLCGSRETLKSPSHLQHSLHQVH